MRRSPIPTPVTHVLEAYASAGTGLWGKERLVQGLMLAQRESGALEPRLIAFVPCRLADEMREFGFPVTILEERHRRVPVRAFPALRVALRSGPATIVHTHGYKANLVGRMARLSGSPMRALIATCHAWFDESPATALYNELDRRTAFMSDMTTVADARMLARFPKRLDRTAYIANGLPDRAPATSTERVAARARFGFPEGRIVFGYLARTNAAKGLPEFLESARRCTNDPYLWAIAGTGDLAHTIADAALPNVRFLGYVAESDAYRASIDVFVQASHIEGLSLSLLEAMRAGLPIVATDAGSTSLALRNEIDGLIIAPGDIAAMVASARRIANQPSLATRLGTAARSRFVDAFRSDRQHREFLEIYEACGNAYEKEPR